MVTILTTDRAKSGIWKGYPLHSKWNDENAPWTATLEKATGVAFGC